MALVPSMPTKMAMATDCVRPCKYCHGEGTKQKQLTKEEPKVETNDNHNHAYNATPAQRSAQRHVPEHNTELLVSKRQRPQTEV